MQGAVAGGCCRVAQGVVAGRSKVQCAVSELRRVLLEGAAAGLDLRRVLLQGAARCRLLLQAESPTCTDVLKGAAAGRDSELSRMLLQGEFLSCAGCC